MIKELNSFDELNNENLIKGIYVSGFETPSNIQKISIPSFMNYENMIIQSRSGSGKTLCFIIGSLLNVNINDNDTQIIIMAPTRELSE
jgi:superfamily II DNA/RNA helicase